MLPSNVDSEGTTDKLTENTKREMVNSEQVLSKNTHNNQLISSEMEDPISPDRIEPLQSDEILDSIDS